MSTVQEKAKVAKRNEIIFTVVELVYAVGILILFSNVSNEFVHSFVSGAGRHRGSYRSDKERERDRYDEERDNTFANVFRIIILVLIVITILVEIGLELFALNRLSKAVELSDSNPQEAMRMGFCYVKIQKAMACTYGVTLVLMPAFVLRLICLVTVGRFMRDLLKELQMRNQVFPGMSPVFGQGQYGVIRTQPQSNTDPSMLPGSSGDASQFQTV